MSNFDKLCQFLKENDIQLEAVLMLIKYILNDDNNK